MFAEKHDVILVLKGDRTIVAGPDGEAWVNPTGNPGMATGGTGDILTGIVAGLSRNFPSAPLEAVIGGGVPARIGGRCRVQSIGEQSLVATDLHRRPAGGDPASTGRSSRKVGKNRAFVHQRTMNPGSGLR